MPVPMDAPAALVGAAVVQEQQVPQELLVEPQDKQVQEQQEPPEPQVMSKAADMVQLVVVVEAAAVAAEHGEANARVLRSRRHRCTRR